MHLPLTCGIVWVYKLWDCLWLFRACEPWPDVACDILWWTYIGLLMAFIYIFPDPTVQHVKYGNWLLDHLCSLWRLSQGSEIFGSWSASSLSAVRQHSTSLQPVLLRHTFRSVVWCNWGPVVAHKKAHCNRVPYLHMFSMNLEASNKHGPWWQDAVPQDGSWNAQTSEFPTHPHKLAIHYILCYDIILYAVHAISCNIMQYDAIWCNMMQYDAICVVWVNDRFNYTPTQHVH